MTFNKFILLIQKKKTYVCEGAILMFEFLGANIFYLILHINGAGAFPQPLGEKKEALLIEKMCKGDKEARALLIEHNLRLVAHVVKKYGITQDEQDDLISIGTIGLIKAIDSFKSDKKTRLATYAARCIENEILMHFRSKKKTANDVSLNEEIDTDKDGNSLSLIDVIAEEDRILENIFRKTKTEELRKAIKEKLDDRERLIINLRYGITEPALTQKDTALRLGISRSYVSRLEKKALETLKKELKSF